MKSTSLKKKSLSPLISTILLVVVAVILVTLILTWGKDFVNTNLDDTQAFGNLVSSDATHFIFSPSIKDNILKFNYTPPESLKNENLVITHYTVLEISDLDEPISLHDSITLYPGINLITLNGLYAYSADTSDLTIQLIASNNTFLIIKVNDPNIVCVTKGNGSEEDPYVICTADDLNNIRNNKEGNNIIGNYVLGKNIDLDISPYNQGSGFEPIGSYLGSNSFTGSFNGNYFTISNLYIKRSTTNFVGLFGDILDATIINVGLVDVNITGDEYVSALVGEFQSGLISNCYSTGIINGFRKVGGLIGIVNNIDYNLYKIENSFSTASINGNYEIGGLIGNIHYGIIEVSNCFSSGSVSGQYVGGLIGDVEATLSITNSFYDTETSGQSDIGKGTLKSTTQMKTQSTFTGWDFTNVWAIDEGTTYPYLRNFTYNANNPKPA